MIKLEFIHIHGTPLIWDFQAVFTRLLWLVPPGVSRDNESALSGNNHLGIYNL